MSHPAALKGRSCSLGWGWGSKGSCSDTRHPAHTHTVHTHIQMRSVAEGFELSSVVSSIEVTPDCSNKGVPELKQDSHKLELKALREVSLAAERKWEALLFCLNCFICWKQKYVQFARPSFPLSIYSDSGSSFFLTLIILVSVCFFSSSSLCTYPFMSSSFSPFCTWCIISLRSFSLFTHINTLHSVAVIPKRTNKIELPFSLLLPSSWLLVAESTVICPVSSGFFLFPSALVSWCLSSLWCSKIYTLMPPASTVCQVPSLIQRHTKQNHKPAALPFFVCLFVSYGTIIFFVVPKAEMQWLWL